MTKEADSDTVHIPRSGRQRVSENIPSHEQLMAIKRKKKVRESLYIELCNLEIKS